MKDACQVTGHKKAGQKKPNQKNKGN